MRYEVRELCQSDIENGLFETLAHLSSCGDLTVEEAKGILARIQENIFHKVFVAIDTSVVGVATLLIEQKFIHNGGRVGHIEDVVTKEGYEGRGIASSIIRVLLDIAKAHGCYKIILDCNESNVLFYERFGFKRHEIEMRLDL